MFELEHRVIRIDGTTGWTFSRAVPVLDDAGEITEWLGTARDVTARRQSEEALRENERRLAEANRVKDEFLAMLSHELRNPLAPILTAVQVSRLRGITEGERERQIIERQVMHLVSLVDDLLDVSRITTGKITLSRAPIEIGRVIARAVETASPLLERKGHELHLDVPAHGLCVHADSARLAQVVSNLIGNAAKYTEPGGRIEVRAFATGDDVVVSVRDTGIGIAPEMVSRVFDPFVQERQALDRSQGGLGLGLAIVRNLVTLHGGTVEARSDGPGQGAEFLMRLPHITTSVDTIRESPRANLTAQTAVPRRILVVDDNADAAAMLGEALRGLGHVVATAGDGLEALQAARTFRPDVALLDLGLPVMDGYEVAKTFRADPELRTVRLVAVTGYGQEQDRRRSQEAGFTAHLVKPLKIERLLPLIETGAETLSDAE